MFKYTGGVSGGSAGVRGLETVLQCNKKRMTSLWINVSIVAPYVKA